jgi:NAD(P)-dependent dehydrogenase (short-subunit alcohol dehydrogenase family)
MDLTEADWDRIDRVNAKGVFFCLQRAAREMIGQGGGLSTRWASTASCSRSITRSPKTPAGGRLGQAELGLPTR